MWEGRGVYMCKQWENMIKTVLYLIRDDYVFHKSTIKLQSVFFCELNEEEYKQVDYYFKAVRQDFGKILTIMNCIDDTFTMYKEDRFSRPYHELIGGVAQEEMACHIEYLFIKARVILEYMEEILAICIPRVLPEDKRKEYNIMLEKRGKKIPADRFDYLLKYISANNKEHNQLLNTSWFQQFRRNRNFLVHRGASCVVFGNKTEILFRVMKIDEMERDDKIDIDEYFLNERELIRYNRFWGIIISQLILFCEIIFEFLLSKAAIMEPQKEVLENSNYSKRMFSTEEVLDKQAVLEKMLNSLLQEERTLQ